MQGYQTMTGHARMHELDRCDCGHDPRTLMLAAPDLLEALEDARLEHSCDWNGCWHEKADAAIAKAKGQTDGN